MTPENQFSSVMQIVPADIYGLQNGDDWRLPDQGVLEYVRNEIQDVWEFNISDLDRRWVPIIIQTTFDWLRICGVLHFAFRNKAVYRIAEIGSRLWQSQGRQDNEERLR